MAATSYLVSANRYVRQAATQDRYAINASAAAVAEAADILKSTSSAWVSSPRTKAGSVPNHTGALTATSDQYDAYAFCGDHNAVSGEHRAFVGAVAYRVKLPAAAFAGGVNIQTVAVTVNGDPYLLGGARVSVVNNSTTTPEPDWATLFAGTANATQVAKRTAVTSGSTTTWYPTSEAKTLTLSEGGTQAYQYIWIYLALEDYNTTSRIPWIEGGASLSPTITVTFADAIGGLTAGSNIGGTEAMADLACNRVTLLDKSFCYYQSKSGTSCNTTAVERFNSLIANFATPTIIEATGTDMAFAGISAGVAWTNEAGMTVCAAVFPVSAHIPAGMPIRSLILSRPPDWTGCSFVLSAYWVEGPIATADATTVPATDHDFWMGLTLAPTIAGKTASLLGRVVMTSRPAGTVAIPVAWTAVDAEKTGTVYIIMMPVDVVTADGSGSIKIGGLSIGAGPTYPAVITSQGATHPWLPTTVSFSPASA